MVLDTYAAVDPGTVVVKTLNTTVANVAMASSRGPDDFALRAECRRIESFKHLLNIINFSFITINETS